MLFRSRALRADLDRIRTSGFVDSRSSFEAGVDSVATPVFDYSGTVVAAINASGPESAFSGPRGRRGEIIEAVCEAAVQISRRLGFSHRTSPAPQNDVPQPRRVR